MEIEWLIDSGYTDHVVNSDNYFYEYIYLKNPIKVISPDGKELNATKLGKIEIAFKNDYERKVNSNNVYYVNGTRKKN